MLTIAVSSRSLFHMEEANSIYDNEGQAAFDGYMLRTENEPLPPGAAFSLVRKLLALNSKRSPDRRDRVEVVLLSRNSADAGMRVMNSVHHHNLDIEQAVFTSGDDRFRYASALEADLFLCAEPADARAAIINGVAAATITPFATTVDHSDLAVRLAFDGDSVLFSGEADAVYREHGLAQFVADELSKAGTPLGDGPFKRLFTKLCVLRNELPPEMKARLLIGLATARAVPNHGRPLVTLRSWGLGVDVAMFTAGKDKGPFLRAFGADMFFDDMARNCASAGEHGIPSGHVPSDADGILTRA